MSRSHFSSFGRICHLPYQECLWVLGCFGSTRPTTRATLKKPMRFRWVWQNGKPLPPFGFAQGTGEGGA
ncbi:MAG: hypothetical protein ACKO24_10635 [Leptolyngbyaceae cyanobacterium]